MAASATEMIPCVIDHLDEYIESPGLYVYPDTGTMETVIGVTGLENVVEIVLNRQQLNALLIELEGAEDTLIAVEAH